MYENILKSANLNDNEIKIYSLLLNHGEHTAAQVAQKSGIKRANTYYVLDGLQQKELVEEFKKGKKTFFRMTHPQQLEAYVEQQLKTLEEARKTVNAAIPSLTSDYNLVHNKPGVSFFEGKEGLKKVFQDIYAPAKDKTEVIGCVELEKVDKVLPDMLDEEIIPKRVKSKLHSKAFFIDSPQARKLEKDNASQNRETILVDGKEYPMPAEIDVYKDKIAMLSFEHGKFVGIIIENQAIATTLESVFRLAWDKSQKTKS